MWTAEGTPGDERVALVRQPGYGVNFCGLQGLLPGHIRQDGGKPPGQHGFSGAGRANEQNIVPACCGNLQRPFYILLPHHIGKIRSFLACGGFRQPDRGGSKRFRSPQMLHQLGHMLHRIYRQPLGQRSLCCVLSRHEQLPDAQPPCRQCHGQHTRHRTQSACQAHLTDEGCIRRQLADFLGCRQNAQQNGQVIQCAFLPLSRRGQIHRNAADRESDPAVFHSRPHALTGFPHGGIRQPYNLKSGQPAGEKTLHTDLISADARQPQRTHGYHHKSTPFLSI